MIKRLFYCFLAIFLLLLNYNEKIIAQALVDLHNPNVNIMILYSTTEHDESHPRLLELNLLLGHFSNNITIKHIHDIDATDLNNISHVFYYGITDEHLNEKTVQFLNEFHGDLFLIGQNMEQFDAYQNLNIDEEVLVSSIGSDYSSKLNRVKYPLKVNKINEENVMDVLLYGYDGDNRYPILVQVDKQRYFLTIDERQSRLNDVVKNHVAELLHDIFPHNHFEEHIGYLRLEDIHPLSDPKLLREVGEYLNEQGIPYMLVVSPIYVHPGTTDQVYLSEKKELVEVLQYLQDTGGTVVSHGFTHQYYNEETGEGFEFWDVRHNQFVMAEDPSEAEFLLNRHEFTNDTEYEQYISRYKEVEGHYVRSRIEQAINELVALGLYPLAFEAPHYTMSQQGYSIVAEYYSTILGQVQISDDDWQLMTGTPYLTTANFLNGVDLYPETIGFYDPGLIHPTVDTEYQLDSLLVVRDGFIGAFFHPYLGVENLQKFLKQFEHIPNLKWMDLKKTSQHVQTDKITIQTDGTGTIQVDNTWGRWEYFIEQRKASPLENVLWGITALVALFVILFLCIALYLRLNVKKKLFDERTP